MASSLTSASAFVRDVSSPKRVSWGGTRVNAGKKHSTDSTSRVRIFKDDLEKWKTLKLATGKVSDQDFCHFLLELAEKSIQTSYDGHFSSPVNVRSEFMQSLLPQSLTSTPVTSTPISHDTIHKVPSRSLFSQDSTSVRAAEVTSCSLSKTLALRDDYESSESDDESSDDERTLSVICDNDDSVADYDTEIETNCDSSADSDCDERFETEPGCQSAGIQAEDPSVDQEFDEIRHKRIIVSIANLKQLFPSHCSIAECSNKLYNTAKLIGSSLKVTSTCTAGHVTQWSSSDPHYDKKNSAINENDLLFAASILFSGNHYAKISQFCSILGLACITEAMFYRYQKLYLIPTVEKFWTQHITSIKEKFAHKELIASGDGRCDSPGSSAKFCTYSMMSETGEVVELQTVDKREVNFKSPLMECEGLKRCLDNIAANSTMKVKELTTDASITVIAMMRDKYPSIVHSLDVWHKAKKLKKSLSQAGKKKGYEKIKMWSDQICNHFWYCCKECNGDVEKLESM
ncbi:PREDICTED: uncharacterized protein LOC100634668 [Amphimedon queenslandica]|uniref:Uncharacterized protein n=1 Tax=Amphimedon queenslandica TaxID=400682 RepID=A0A1X7T0L7_AMPQE|nr:PREDICTED: uncharacterized protein LOC100634668 [Amphimedon queenslandica]|eukprot:XP_019861927.1 PREDICTED: uncharacterized protein LOC100634668 [Amphimedon queenslandica]